DAMPRLVEGCEVSSRLRPDLASRWGMRAAVVAGGAGDNAAAAIGMGTVHDGAAFASLGTSGVLFAANDAYRPDPESAVHAFCHALPNTWHQMGVILSATDALNWFAGIVGQPAAALTAGVGSDTSNDPLFLPYLAGERTPHNDATIRGSFIGLDHGHDRAAMTRAVLEGVAFALADCRGALEQAGTTLTRVTAVGGGAASADWLQIVADALRLPVDVPAEGEFGAAFGAARLGLMAATGATVASVCTMPAIGRTVEPKRNNSERYEHFRTLYGILKEQQN
ncbi:FGGY-family carbohydrate kinase, partial [Rhizobiaceae bacterium]|nr:FGGY-family carbohydrate kinase [Rhizobiaceae bacterium]